MAYIDEKMKAMDAENLNYQAMLESFKDKRNPDLIKDFSDGETHTAEESVANKNINPDAIPDKVEGENNYGILGDTVATGYNAAKIVAEEVMMPLPLAERLLGWNLYSDEGSEYSGIKDFFSEWGKQTLEAPDFVPISKSQRDSDFLNRIEDYKQNYVLTGDKITEHLNKALGLDISSINNKDDPGSLISKYKGNAEVSNAVSNEIKKLEDIYQEDKNLIGNDFWEDENFYYIKKFKELPFAPNMAWTQHGDLAIPGLGVYKINEEGQGAMIANAPFNLEHSGRVGGGGDEFEYLNRGSVGSWLADQGFGMKQDAMGEFELYGDPGAQSLGIAASLPLTGFAFNPAAVSKVAQAPGIMSKAKELTKGTFSFIPHTKSSIGAAVGIGTLPTAAYYGFLD